MILHSPNDPLVTVKLPMPPSDNNLVRLARLGAYPTNDYRGWLRVAAPILDDAIADRRSNGGAWEDYGLLLSMGRRPWYSVHAELAMPSGRRDAANYEKALFDLLSGKRCESDRKSSKIVMGPGVWPDDSLLAHHTTSVSTRGGVDHWVRVEVYLEHPPRPIDVVAKLRPKCERRLQRMIKGEAPPCLVCRKPAEHQPSSHGWIIPGPATVTAVICTDCAPCFDSHRGTGREMILSRPDLHWEFVHAQHDGMLYEHTIDLIWN